MDLLPIRELLRERSSPGATHWGECWRTHVDCAAQLLLSEVERLKAERDRLADGIRFLVNTYDPYEAPDASMPVRELRLLDVAGDDPPVPYRALEGSEGGEGDR